jgi:type I restriction enzyme S subunit
MASEASAAQSLHIPDRLESLPDGWEWYRLDVICDEIVDCPHSTPALTEIGPLLARSQDIRTGVFRVEMAGRVSEETYKERIARAEPRHGDLLYSREGTYFGIAAEVPPGTRVCLGQRMVLIRPNKKRMNSRFLWYWLNSPIIATHIFGFRDGTVAERLNLPTIRGLPVAVPPCKEQDAIACVLGTLDDKIELNRRTNQTLEGLARAVFRSWFVDFDPVVLKAAARSPVSMKAAAAALFPDSFLDSPIGPIPKGWGVEPLPEVIEVNPPRRLLSGVRAPYVDMGNMPTDSARVLRWIDREAGSGMRFQNGDTLVARITPCLENGKTAYVDFLADGQVGWGSTEYIVLRSKPPLSPEFAYLLARTEEFRSHAIANMTGSSGRQRVPADSLRNFFLAVPGSRIAELFGKWVKPLFDGMKTRGEQSDTLAALRDALLPRLLSGELRLTDAKRAIGAVV